MSRYRHSLPQLSGDLFLTGAGLETDLMFNHGIEVKHFASHTLLPDKVGRQALTNYYRGLLTLAQETGAGFILETETFKAQMFWAETFGATEDELHEINNQAVAFAAGLRGEFSANEQPIILNGGVGSQGDAYNPEPKVAAEQAEHYHAKQLSWLAQTDIDMVTGYFPESVEPVGFVRASRNSGLPAAVSLTLETDGRLHTGQPLQEAIESIDEATDNGAAYFMVHCVHPDHLPGIIEGADWARRIRGIRCNASRKSHAELNESETLDDGNPVELGSQYKEIKSRMPWVNIVGGCCGTDLRHVTQIARAIAGSSEES